MSSRSRRERRSRQWWLLLLVMMIWPCSSALARPQAESDAKQDEARTAEERKSAIDEQIDAALAALDELLANEQQRLAEGGGAGTVVASPGTPVSVRTKAEDEPKIILYETSWCGYCRQASKLLKQLDVDFEAKDIERDPKAAAEYRRKSGGRGGVPLIDIDGEVVRGYDKRLIRQLVAEMQKKKK